MGVLNLGLLQNVSLFLNPLKNANMTMQNFFSILQNFYLKMAGKRWWDLATVDGLLIYNFISFSLTIVEKSSVDCSLKMITVGCFLFLIFYKVYCVQYQKVFLIIGIGSGIFKSPDSHWFTTQFFLDVFLSFNSLTILIQRSKQILQIVWL